MSFLQQVATGRRPQGIRIAICAQEKMGKTTLSCGAPDSLLVPLEVGYESVTSAKTPMIQTWDELQSLQGEIFAALQAGQFPYKTIVYDSATALERMIHDKTLSRDASYGKGNAKAVTMESALGGYGKAYTYANELFDIFLKQCDQLAVYGQVNIVITCHAFASKMVDPQAGEFDSWDILLHSPKNNKTYGKREMLTQWVDMLGFLYEPMYISKGEDKVAKGVSANKGRVLGLSRTPAYVAGNRYGIMGEIQIPAADGWNHLANAIYQSSGVDVFKR